MGKKEGMAVVIGGMVLDIHATASVPATPNSTTPGKIKSMPGGVARNIVECLLKLGTKSFMLSAVGCDREGDLLLEMWMSAGLPVEGIQRGLHITTASVCNVFDTNGDLTAGVASVDTIEKHVTPQWIKQFKSIIESSPLMMVDANLSRGALAASCQMAADLDVPVWFEPVSITKSTRVTSIVSYITFASPNEHELVAMANALTHGNSFDPILRDHDKTNASIESLFKHMKPAILVLLQKVKYVIVTLGPDGVFLCTQSGPSCFRDCLSRRTSLDGKNDLNALVGRRCPIEHYSHSMPCKGGSQLFVMHFPALPATVGKVSGAGDCLVSGMIASLCSGLNIMQSMAVGIAAAKASIEVEANVPDNYSLAAIADDAGVAYNAARVVFQESRL